MNQIVDRNEKPWVHDQRRDRIAVTITFILYGVLFFSLYLYHKDSVDTEARVRNFGALNSKVMDYARQCTRWAKKSRRPLTDCNLGEFTEDPFEPVSVNNRFIDTIPMLTYRDGENVYIISKTIPKEANCSIEVRQPSYFTLFAYNRANRNCFAVSISEAEPDKISRTFESD